MDPWSVLSVHPAVACGDSSTLTGPVILFQVLSSSSVKNLYRGSFYPESCTPILISFSAANANSRFPLFLSRSNSSFFFHEGF